MANKRCRSGSSQSFFNLTLLDQPPLSSPEILPETSALQTDLELTPQSRQINFSDPSSPPPLDRRAKEDFLARCYGCKKRLDHTKDIFLYNDSSFCTHECRNIVISVDKAAEDARKKAMKQKTSNRGMNR